MFTQQHRLVSDYLRSSITTASTRRRIITRNELSGYDAQELQFFNASNLNSSENKIQLMEKP